MTQRTIVRSAFSRDISDDDPSDLFWHACFSCGRKADLPFFPSRFTDATRSGRHFFQHINFPEFALEMILSGEVEYRTEEKSDICRQGDIYVIPPGSTVRFANISDAPRRKIAILFNGTHAGLFADALGFWECLKLTPPDADDFEKRIRKLGTAIRRNRQPTEKLMLKGMELLLHLRQFIPRKEAEPGIQRSCRMMDSEISNAMLTAEELAKSAGLSASDFRQKFYRTFGISPMKYLMQLRMEKAENLLKQTGESVKRIAAQCGFNSSHAFSRTFSRHFGISPAAMRKAERKHPPQE